MEVKENFKKKVSREILKDIFNNKIKKKEYEALKTIIKDDKVIKIIDFDHSEKAPYVISNLLNIINIYKSVRIIIIDKKQKKVIE